MALPANWQPRTPPASPADTASRIALTILLCALGGAIWTLFKLFVGFKVLRPPALIISDMANPEYGFFGAVSAPYLCSFVSLLIPSHYPRSFACGLSSIAAIVLIYYEGLFLVLLVLSLPFEHSSMRSPGPPSGPIAIVVFFSLLCHGLILFSSLILCAVSVKEVRAAVAAAAAGAILVMWYADYIYSTQQSSIARHWKDVQDVDKESAAAFRIVESISWCAIGYAQQHGGQSYPASLDVIGGNPVCRRSWSLSAIPHYTVIYTPTATGFSVKAVAPSNPLRAPRNAESDESGVALIEYQDPSFNAYPAEVGTGSPLGDVYSTRGWLRDYAIDHKQIGYPRTLNDVPYIINLFRQSGISQFLSATSIKYGEYLFSYAPATPDSAGKTNSYQMQVTCLNYGDKCLHSFLLTSEGHVFFTTANRPASTADTKLLRCPPRHATTFCSPGD